jgi:hypothetical protein
MVEGIKLNGPLTGWVDTDAADTVICVQCGAGFGEDCRTATSTPKDTVHPRRRERFLRYVAPPDYVIKSIEF